MTLSNLNDDDTAFPLTQCVNWACLDFNKGDVLGGE